MIDLHCHSICSDGSDKPATIAEIADQLGIKAVALTDHDTLAGLDDFLDQQSRVSTRLIPGIELSCNFSGSDLHVLGLFIDHHDTLFQERVRSLSLRRDKRNVQIFQKLNDLKIKIRPEDFFEDEQLGLLTRAHIADMLVETGHAATRVEVFQKYLGEGAQAYIPFEFLSPDDAFTWIREARGLPFIAHPGRFARGQFVWDSAMADLRDRGARGVEVYYSDHSETETAYFLALCKALDMLPSGGSDYHGRHKPGCKLGTGWGNLNVPDWILNGL
ncbi:MAG: PHP domain-containing protein [Holophagales bacterium]|jgi:predicted metal-dependent phosphoesterase TrpH|nr:PHP domain-containing protein [Holophagales bacterium]